MTTGKIRVMQVITLKMKCVQPLEAGKGRDSQGNEEQDRDDIHHVTKHLNHHKHNVHKNMYLKDHAIEG